MFLTGIITGLTASLVILLFLGGIFYVTKRKLQTIIRAFFEPTAKDAPSPFALVVSHIASIFGSEISASLKATFMGIQSVESRNARKSGIEEVAGKNPLLGILLQSFPKVSKRLLGNGLGSILESVLTSSKQGGQAIPTGSTGSTGSIDNHDGSPFRF